MALLAAASALAAENSLRQARIRDISSVEGVRANPLAGYGLVVGLNGTGDRQQTLFPVQTLITASNLYLSCSSCSSVSFDNWL